MLGWLDRSRDDGVGRSIALLDAFRFEQSEPSRFYGLLAQDSVRLVQQHVPLEGRTVADVGCGPREFGDSFRAAGAQYFPVDVDHSELVRMGQRVGTALCADGRRLPFRDGAIDVTFSSNVVEHVRAPWAFADEVVRVTRPGGLAVISYTNWLSPWGGHETSPFHYLGGRDAVRRYTRRYGHPPKNRVGENLFRVSVAAGLAWARRCPGAELVDARPRYLPAWARPLVHVPALREIATWNLLLVLRRTWTSASALVLRLRLAAVSVALAALAVLQSPGLMVADTKSDLVLDPWHFLSRSLDAWDPNGFGQLQNQAYGYLFPMGPFFGIGHSLGVPEWLVQRSWWALLLVVAFLGAYRLAQVLRIGGPTAQIVAGLAYALSTRMLTTMGPISAESLPMAVLPWIAVPLVLARTGRERQAALTSAVAALFLGGINATASLVVLVLPLVLILRGDHAVGVRRARLLGWWSGATALACAWWLLPLVVQARYAFPFLDFIESAETTTSVTSLPNVWRGADHWVAYAPAGGGPAWPAGWQLATSPLLVAVGLVVAGGGCAGLVARGMPWRRSLSTTAVIGILAMAVGYAGPAGGPFAEQVRELLDGPLAPLRNVHKFDPLVRLPLALGLAYGIQRVATWVAGRRTPPALTHRATAHRATAAVALGSVLVLAWPALTFHLAPRGPYASVPSSWRDAAEWLDENAHGSRSLLLPGARFAEFTWGSPLDEPIQALSGGPYAVRIAVPLGAPGAYRVLDEMEKRLGRGAADPLASQTLARMGVGLVVLRRDLDETSGADDADVVAAALSASPGFRRVAAFGPVQIFEVEGSSGLVRAYAGAPVRLSGAPEVIAVAPDVVAERATVLATDEEADGKAADAGATSVVTDTARRRVASFGASPLDAFSETLQSEEDPPHDSPAMDLTDVTDGTDGNERRHQTTVRFSGVESLSASSSASRAGSDRYIGPEAQPWSAIDGDTATAWVPSEPGGARLELSFDEPLELGLVDVTLGEARGRAGTVTIATDGRPTTRNAEPGEQVRLRSTDGLVTSLTIELSASLSAAGIAEIELPTPVARVLITPPDAVDAAVGVGTVVLHRDPRARPACVGEVGCDDDLERSSEDVGPLVRRIHLTQTTTASVSSWLTIAPGTSADRLLDAAVSNAWSEVSGSSRRWDTAGQRPGAAVDGLDSTAWVPDRSDDQPTLTLVSPDEVGLAQVRVRFGPGAPSERDVVIASGDERRVVELDNAGRGRFPVLSGSTFTLQFTRLADDFVSENPSASRFAVADVAFAGLGLSRARDVVVGCDDPAAPTVTLDGARVAMSVSAPYAAVVNGDPVEGAACETRRVDAGAVDVVEGADSPLVVDRLVLSPSDAVGTTDLQRPTTVEEWSAERRVVRVGGGDAATLVVSESANAGWRATADGEALEHVRVDGWSQAWRLEADTASTTVLLEFAPGRWYRLGLWVGLGAVVVLVLLALGTAIDRRARRVDEPMASIRAQPPHPGRRWSLVSLGACAAVGFVVAGPAGAVLTAGVKAVPRPWRSAVAGSSLALVGLLLVAAELATSDAWSVMTQLLAVVALGALVDSATSPSLVTPEQGALEQAP